MRSDYKITVDSEIELDRLQTNYTVVARHKESGCVGTCEFSLKNTINRDHNYRFIHLAKTVAKENCDMLRDEK